MAYKVYLITNKETGMYYVGQTNQPLEERWKQHCYYRPNPLLREDINIFGQEAFTIETLCVCPDPTSADKAERFFIRFMGATKRSLGYNRHPGPVSRAFTTASEQEIISLAERKKKEGTLKQWLSYGLFKLSQNERLAYEKVLIKNGYMKDNKK